MESCVVCLCSKFKAMVSTWNKFLFFFLLERTWLLLSWGKRACVKKKKRKKVAAKLEEVCP